MCRKADAGNVAAGNLIKSCVKQPSQLKPGGKRCQQTRHLLAGPVATVCLFTLARDAAHVVHCLSGGCNKRFCRLLRLQFTANQ